MLHAQRSSRSFWWRRIRRTDAEARLVSLGATFARPPSPAAIRPIELPSEAAVPASALSRPAVSAVLLLLLAAAVVVVTLFVRPDEQTLAPAAPRAFTAAVVGGGRVIVPADGETLNVRVVIAPEVRTFGGWFWCLDAEPALPAADRVCASEGAENGGRIAAERSIAVDPARAYFVQLYCAESCDWTVERIASAQATTPD
jgi:hypothetical protein